jgi:hypothetical protein
VTHASTRSRRITADGTADCAYAVSPDTNLQMVTRQVQGVTTPPVALWSPDSQRRMTHRLDQGSGVLPLVQSCPTDGSTRPVNGSVSLIAWFPRATRSRKPGRSLKPSRSIPPRRWRSANPPSTSRSISRVSHTAAGRPHHVAQRNRSDRCDPRGLAWRVCPD